MTTFKNEMPGDMVTLEMRIKEDVRHVLRAMFISSDDKKKMLEDALESAISSGNILNVVEKHAHQAINEAVQEYFSYGEGGKALRKAINEVLSEIIPQILNKDYDNG
jgi:F0F1-type ATP synthase delta subunit